VLILIKGRGEGEKRGLEREAGYRTRFEVQERTKK